MKLVDVVPIGTRTAGTMHGPVDLKIYPPYPLGDLFERIRKRLGVTIGATADALGINPSDVSAIKFGRRRFATHEDLVEALTAIVVLSEKANPPRAMPDFLLRNIIELGNDPDDT